MPAVLCLEMMSEQELQSSVAETSIAGFEIRQGQAIGCKGNLCLQTLCWHGPRAIKHILL